MRGSIIVRINKSQVVNALRSAKAEQDRGGSALASLQASAREVGISAYIRQVDVNALENAFHIGGVDGAVRLATNTLRSLGWEVIDGDVEAEPMGVASIATPEPVEVAVTLESAAETLRSALIEGGKSAVSTAVVGLITKTGLTMPQVNDLSTLVDEIVEAIVGNGDLEEVLEDAHEYLSPEVDETEEDEEDEEERTPESRLTVLEESMARADEAIANLVKIAQRHGLA